jgi:hypothetical protein
MLSSAVATLGLGFLRRGRAVPGVATLAGAATLAWFKREKPRPGQARA